MNYIYLAQRALNHKMARGYLLIDYYQSRLLKDLLK